MRRRWGTVVDSKEFNSRLDDGRHQRRNKERQGYAMREKISVEKGGIDRQRR